MKKRTQAPTIPFPEFDFQTEFTSLSKRLHRAGLIRALPKAGEDFVAYTPGGPGKFSGGAWLDIFTEMLAELVDDGPLTPGEQAILLVLSLPEGKPAAKRKKA